MFSKQYLKNLVGAIVIGGTKPYLIGRLIRGVAINKNDLSDIWLYFHNEDAGYYQPPDNTLTELSIIGGDCYFDKAWTVSLTGLKIAPYGCPKRKRFLKEHGQKL